MQLREAIGRKKLNIWAERSFGKFLRNLRNSKFLSCWLEVSNTFFKMSSGVWVSCGIAVRSRQILFLFEQVLQDHFARPLFLPFLRAFPEALHQVFCSCLLRSKFGSTLSDFEQKNCWGVKVKVKTKFSNSKICKKKKSGVQLILTDIMQLMRCSATLTIQWLPWLP